jgi:hypothetical protein
MTMPPNERSGVDAGWRVLFAFQRAWPRATHRERSPMSSHCTLLGVVFRVNCVVFGSLLGCFLLLERSNNPSANFTGRLSSWF